MDPLDSPSLNQQQDVVGDDDHDHVSPSLEINESTEPPPPLTNGETEASLLTTFSPAITVEDTDTITRAVNASAEDASAVLVRETVRSSPEDTALDAVVAARQPVLLGEEASQELLLTAPTAIDTLDRKQAEGNAIVVVMTGDAVEGDEEAADAARGAAIQAKYSGTSEWVESLPLTATPLMANDVTATSDAQGSSTTAIPATRRGKRAREGKGKSQSVSDTNIDSTLRQHCPHDKAAEAELQNAFKHSQRTLRKQAKSVSMRDIFSRSLTLPSPLPLSDDNASSASTFPPSPPSTENDSSNNRNGMHAAGGNLFSPSSSSFRFSIPVLSPSVGSLSPTTPSGNSSAWSPCVVGELTNQFLANVKHQRRQKCEQFVSRELTQSQTLSQTRSLHPRPHGDDGDDVPSQQHQQFYAKHNDTASTNAFSAPVDELVIGDEDNEAANWMPAEASSPASPHGRRMLRDTNANDDVVLLGGSSIGEDGQRYTTPPNTVTSDSRKAEDLASQKQQQQQQQIVQSLARKHEIWKLKQRQLKTQQQVDLDERAKAKQKQQSQQSAMKTATAASALAIFNTTQSRAVTEEVITTASSATTTNTVTAAAVSATTRQNFFCTSQISSRTSTTSRTLHKTNLSADAISMIRRINSFDNTSTQRVVVFGTAASTKQQSREENTP